MRNRKLKSGDTPDIYKQKSITEYFKNIVPAVNRKLFVEDSAEQNMPLERKNMGGTNSDDDFCDLPKPKIKLPLPLYSDEEVRTPKSTKRNQGKPLNNSSDLLLKSKNKPTPKNINARTMIKLNKPSINRGSLSIMENFLSPRTKDKPAVGDGPSRIEETLNTPTKKTKIDYTTENSPLKVELDVELTVANKSEQDIPLRRGTLNNTQNSIRKISSPNKLENNSLQSPSKRYSKSTPNKNKSYSPKASPVKRKLNETPKATKRTVTFGSGNEMKSEGEEEKLNLTQLELLKTLFEEALADTDKKELLTQTDIDIVTEFLHMDVNHQYLLIKLFLYLPKWYNMVKFCSNIKLDQKLSPKDIVSMYEYHKNGRFLDTDIKKLTVNELLDFMMLGDLRQIAVDLKLPKKTHGTKAKLIGYLKQNCKTQTTLTMKKSSEDVLKDAACKQLGFCIHLKADVKSAFNKVYVLQTFTNSAYCTDVLNYLKDVGYGRVVYPSYTIENFNPFSTKDQFLSFYEAVEMHKELDNALENKLNDKVKNLCDEAFRKLQFIDDNGKWKTYLPRYLQKFSAEYRYISLLKRGIMKLTSKYFEDVKVWLQFLIKQYPTNHAIGFWYKQLAHINLQYYKDYENAAQIVIEAYEFNKKENIFDSLQTYELDKLSNKLRNTKSYKLCALYCDRLAGLSQVPVDTNKFVEKFIKGCTDRSGTPGKRIYSYRDLNNEITYGSVENITLRYYEDNEEFEGIHCEGKLIAILFVLLHWDIIYEYYVPRTFISKLQSAPLDMYSDTFYEHRKTEIDLRLEEIAETWPQKKLEQFVEDNWNNHVHERSITDFDSLGKELDEVLMMLQCIDRRILSKIFSRLVTNYRRFRSGLPDLFLWNTETLKCKFVEVKGENDCLQPNQILWINHLIEIGAEVEVCHVSGVGAKNVCPDDEN